jgi:hypothetical protein
MKHKMLVLNRYIVDNLSDKGLVGLIYEVILTRCIFFPDFSEESAKFRKINDKIPILV